MRDRRGDGGRWRRGWWDEEDERGGWDAPTGRGPDPDDPRWREPQRFGPRPRPWDRPWEGPEWDPAYDRDEDVWFDRSRVGPRHDPRGAHSGWGYRWGEDRPGRRPWTGSRDDRDRFGDPDPTRRGPGPGGRAFHERREGPDGHGEESEGPGAFATRPTRGFPTGDDPHRWMTHLSAYRVATGPHAGKGPRGYQRDWGRVRDEVCDLLERDGEIDATDVEVDVDDGVVILRGTVADRHQKRRAERLVDAIPQVRDVHNELRLRRETAEHGLTINGSDHGVPSPRSTT